MEDKEEEIFDTILLSRKVEARGLLRKCFENYTLSLVPFEIWKFVVSFSDPKSVSLLSQTCWGFKELVENTGELLLNLAKRFRQEERIDRALKYLLKSADAGNSCAMFHLGYAYKEGGWGLKAHYPHAAEWLRRAAERGNAAAMAHFALCLKYGDGVVPNFDLSVIWARKALSTNNPYAVGFCRYFELENDAFQKGSFNCESSFRLFEIGAVNGDEFSQFMLGCCYDNGDGILQDFEKAFYWFLKSAEQGFGESQFQVGRMYRDGNGCLQDYDLALEWFNKGTNQGI